MLTREVGAAVDGLVMVRKLGKDLIFQIFGYLYLSDLVSLLLADTASEFIIAAKPLVLPIIAEFDLQVNTVYPYDGNDDDEYEHLQPVIRNRIRDLGLGNAVLPNGCVIFEPKFEGCLRHAYRPDQFKPVDVKLRWRTYTYEWSLEPDSSRRPDINNFRGPMELIPLTNTWKKKNDDRFDIFCYRHEEDHNGAFPIKVFYKTEGDMRKLHCVSIHTGLMARVLQKNCEPGAWRYLIPGMMDGPTSR
jgi:hypothetical protein